MKALIVIPELRGGGIATYYRNFLHKLLQRGFEIKTILTNDSDEEIEEFGSSFNAESLSPDILKKNRQNFKNWSTFPLLQDSLVKGWTAYEQTKGGDGFDFVELTDYPALFIPWLYRCKKIPVVIRLAGSLSQVEMHENRFGQFLQISLLQTIERICLNQADLLIGLSTLNKTYWEDRLNNKVIALPPPLSFEMQDAKTYQEPTKGLGLVIGRVQTWKGAEELCKATELLGNQCPIIEWIGGDNYFRNYSVSMSSYLKGKYSVWGNKIIPLGKMSHKGTQEKLAAAKFLIAPSLWDTFNFTVIEGMSQGKVVICSDGAGAAEHIVDGENGFVYPAKDVKALAEKIRQANDLSDAECRRIGASACATVERVFASEEPIQKRIALYEELIKNGPSQNDDPELDWLKQWLSPEGNTPQTFPAVLLDQLSMECLGKYIVDRLKKKIF